MKSESYLAPLTKINSRWIKDLKIRLKPPRRKQGEAPLHPYNDIFFYYGTKSTSNKRKINNGLHQIKKLHYSKGNSQQNKKAD